MDTLRNGCFGKMVDLPVHTIPKRHPPKMDVLSKSFLQIILAAKMDSAEFKYGPKMATTTFGYSSL